MNEPVFTYCAYGLSIESTMPLPELPTDYRDVRPDVRVVVGPVPDALDDPQGTGVLYQAARDQFLLSMPDIARYLVRNGNEIVIDADPAASSSDVRVFMLGSCIGALLHQREMLVLHAAAMHANGGAVLFAGHSGAGKSTLLGAMLERGHPMMVDDVCGVVDGGDGSVSVLSGYPRTRLWADSAEKLAVSTEHLDRTRPSMEKFERQVPDAFWPDAAPMRQLYILAPHNDDSIEIEELPMINAFDVVLRNTYRRSFLDGLQMTAKHFQLASLVASGVRICRVKRPSGSFKLDQLAAAIEQDLEQS